jgi:translation initiation factor 1A
MGYPERKDRKKMPELTEEQQRQMEISRCRMPRGKEVLGFVAQLLGGKRMYVDCADGKKRLCRVPGRCRRDVWVRPDDYVLVEPWEVQGDERGDIIFKYKRFQVEHLRRKGMLDKF